VLKDDQPGKRIRDPLYGFIRVDREDLRLIDHKIVQRLSALQKEMAVKGIEWNSIKLLKIFQLLRRCKKSKLLRIINTPRP
jgi:hypothetical protein